MIRSYAVGLTLGLLLAAAMPSLAEAQDYPQRTVTFLCPFPAGGGTDILTRMLAQELQDKLKQPFIVENRPGAATILAASTVAKSAPDGYTLLLAPITTLALNPNVYKSLPYDPVNDFIPVAMFGVQPSVLIAAPSKGWKSLADLIAAAKANPGALNFASAGLGSASHWAAERLKVAAGINVQHIPFRGPVEAFTEVMTGRVDYYYLPIAPALQPIRDGKVVALAVSTPKRAPTLPEVPSVVEAGYPGAQYLFWGGVAATAKTPRAIVDKLHAETVKALAVPAVQERLATFGVEPMPMTVEAFGKFYRDDVAAIVKLARDVNIAATN